MWVDMWVRLVFGVWGTGLGPWVVTGSRKPEAGGRANRCSARLSLSVCHTKGSNEGPARRPARRSYQHTRQEHTTRH